MDSFLQTSQICPSRRLPRRVRSAWPLLRTACLGAAGENLMPSGQAFDVDVMASEQPVPSVSFQHFGAQTLELFYIMMCQKISLLTFI